jgi:hypothetical protein
MAITKRNIGLEILRGLQKLKRGAHGRVTPVPANSSIFDCTGLKQLKAPSVKTR